jgi:uncharacterized membrane protein YdjX (TVP38/TMEM64 family)
VKARNPAVAWIAAAGVLLLALAGVVTARLPQAHRWIDRLTTAGTGAFGALPIPHWMAFGTLQILVAAFGFLPASLMAIAAGATYGLVLGTLISALGTMVGGWIAFLLARSVLRPWIAKLVARFPASARFDQAVATEGWRFVMLMRVSPVMPFAATSYGLGLTRIGGGAYLVGTLASLPALVGYVALGAFGRAGFALGHGPGGPLQLLLPAFGIVAVLVAVMRLRTLARA